MIATFLLGRVGHLILLVSMRVDYETRSGDFPTRSASSATGNALEGSLLAGMPFWTNARAPGVWKVFAVQFMRADRTKLEDHRVVGGDGARVAPVPSMASFSEVSEAPPTSKSSVVASSSELGDDHLRLRRREFGCIELLGFLVASVECPGEFIDGGKHRRTRPRTQRRKVCR